MSSAETAYTIEISVFDEFDRCVDPDWLRQVARAALAVEGVAPVASASVVIADDETVAELNAEYRGLHATTDVLSFSNIYSGAYYGDSPRDAGDLNFVLPPGHDTGIGEVIVSLPQARRQAAGAGHTLANELAALLAHGIYHLLGYDHEEEADAAVMRPKERAAIQALRQAGLID